MEGCEPPVLAGRIEFVRRRANREGGENRVLTTPRVCTMRIDADSKIDIEPNRHAVRPRGVLAGGELAVGDKLQELLELDLGQYLMLGRGEDRSGGRERRTLLSDAVEALIAALYLDGGIDPVRRFIEEHVLKVNPDLDDVTQDNNQKVDLQSRAKALGLPNPRYSVVAEEGPDHAKVFVVEVRLGEQLASQARASTKKVASLLAAKQLLEQLENEPV